MIKTENVSTFVHTFSDAGFRIVQAGTGYIYDEAYDVPTSGHTYTEDTTLRSDYDKLQLSNRLEAVETTATGNSTDITGLQEAMTEVYEGLLG